MKLKLAKSLSIGATTLCAAALLCATSATAADHTDSPGAIADPAADITDVYAWMSPDAGKLNLILNIPAAGTDSMFSDAVQYVFHVESSAAFGQAGTKTNIICTFDASQKISCWVGDLDYVTGDASATTGLVSDSGMVRVFAGVRDDPFFFNGSGFGATIGVVKGAAANLTFDAAGCPALDMATSTALVTQLMTEPDGSGAADDFNGNVLSIVLEIDKSLVNAGGPTLAVWGSTRR